MMQRFRVYGVWIAVQSMVFMPWIVCLAAPISFAQEKHGEGDLELKSAVLKTLSVASVPARVEGILTELTVREGDVVAKGQLLGKLDDQAVRLKLRQLQHQVDIAKAVETNDIDLRLAKKRQQVSSTEFERAEAANSQVPDTYPRNEIDRLRLVSEQATLEVERAEFSRAMAKLNTRVAASEYEQAHALFKRHLLNAPLAGTIVEVQKHVGEWVSAGMEVMRIVSVDQLRAEGFLEATEATMDLVGKSAEVSLIGDPLVRVPGIVTFISPDANPVNAQVRVYVEVDNRAKKLRPGVPIKVRILTEPASMPAEASGNR